MKFKHYTFLLVVLPLFAAVVQFISPTDALAADEPVRMIHRAKKAKGTSKSDREEKKKERSSKRRVRRRYHYRRGPYRREYYSSAPVVVVARAAPPVYVETGSGRYVDDTCYGDDCYVATVAAVAAPDVPVRNLYATVSGAYVGIKGDSRANNTVFTGLGYGVGVGYTFPFWAAEVGFEGSNHWYSNATGWPVDLNLYSMSLDIRAQWPLWLIEPFLYIGVGSVVYHPNPDRVGKGVDLWDWGVAARAGVGIQLNLGPFGVSFGYGHRWYNLGGEDANYEDLEIQASSYRATLSYYF